MYQKLSHITLIVSVVLLLLGALLYYIPWPSRVNVSLDAAKVDQVGNIVGNTTITIKGLYMNYLFQEDSLEVEIYPFDDLRWIGFYESQPSGREGIISSYFRDCKMVYCTASSPSASTEFGYHCELLFTPNFRNVAFITRDISNNGTGHYYVASANNEVPIEELIEYFRYLPPFG